MKQILLEISKQDLSDSFYNYSFGVWCKSLFEKGVTEIVDYYGVSASIDFQYTQAKSITSVQVEKINYDLADSLADCKEIEGSFFFDYATQFIYIHFINNSRQLGKEIIIGVVFGYSKKNSDVTNNIYGSTYYDPRVIKFPSIKKNIAGSFYGRMKYPSAVVECANNDGHFDTWRSQNLFGTSGRLMYVDNPTQYSDFAQIYSGFIADDSSDWEKFSVDLDDERKRLEQPVATNRITLAQYPNAPDSSIDKVKPVVYGKVFYRKAICIDDSATAKFIFADTMYNPVESLEGVYIDGVSQTAGNISLLDATFTLATTDIDNVYVSFTMPVKNGVAIIKHLMEIYDNKKFLPTYYEVMQTNRAQVGCRNTSLYVDKDTKLKDLIESICFDCDLRYFYTDTGKIVIRLYDNDREIADTILYDDWLDRPTKSNSGSEYLTQCTVLYAKRDDEDKYILQYINTDYEAQAYETYKKLKPKTFETGLYEYSAAVGKSETIMQYSSNVTDICTRTVNWNFKDLEITDFVLASPFERVSNVLNETLAVWEIIGIEKNLENFTIKLTLRYVKAAPNTWDGIPFSDGLYLSSPASDGSQDLTNNMQITEG